ncbi:MAG: ComEA family DNA-binding protein [Dehalococcoidia bacterium]
MGTWLERNRSVCLAALCAVIVTGLVILVLQRRNGPRPLELRFDDPSIGGAAIEVYVTGAVANPGIYALRDGDRVADALAAAGGPTDQANIVSLNLAERVHDEGQVIVPSVSSVAGASVTAEPTAPPLAPGEKININTAGAAELDALPGIGAVYSQRIVDSRQSAGPFGSADELVSRKLIPSATYNKIKDLITVATP